MRLSPRRFAMPLVLAATGGLLFVGCSDDSKDSSAQIAEACAAYSRLTDAVAKVADLNSSSSVGDVKEVRDQIADAYTDAVSSLASVGEDRQTKLDDAWKAFDASVADLDEDLAIRDALASLQEEANAIRTAQEAVGQQLDCAS